MNILESEQLDAIYVNKGCAEVSSYKFEYTERIKSKFGYYILSKDKQINYNCPILIKTDQQTKENLKIAYLPTIYAYKIEIG